MEKNEQNINLDKEKNELLSKFDNDDLNFYRDILVKCDNVFLNDAETIVKTEVIINGN